MQSRLLLALSLAGLCACARGSTTESHVAVDKSRIVCYGAMTSSVLAFGDSTGSTASMAWLVLERPRADVRPESDYRAGVITRDRSIPAQWRAGPGDSVHVVWFDSFVFVGYELVVDSAAARGTGHWTGDEAVEVAPGKVSRSGREWTLRAARVPCTDVPL